MTIDSRYLTYFSRTAKQQEGKNAIGNDYCLLISKKLFFDIFYYNIIYSDGRFVMINSLIPTPRPAPKKDAGHKRPYLISFSLNCYF